MVSNEAISGSDSLLRIKRARLTHTLAAPQIGSTQFLFKKIKAFIRHKWSFESH